MSANPDIPSAAQPAPKPPASERSHTLFPAVAAVVGIVILIVACFAPGGPLSAPRKAEDAGAAPADAAATPAETPAKDGVAVPANASPGVTPADLTALEEKLKTEHEALVKSIDSLQMQMDAMPKPEPAPDLSGINGKLDELTKTAETVAPLPKKVESLEERTDQDNKAIEELRAEIAAIKDELKKSASPVASTEPTKSDAAAVIAPGAELFKEGKYGDALTAFRKAEGTNPDDARVWYYAALANGFTTGKWDGETASLVTKGIEREKAGTPDSATIDETFAGLTRQTGKDWLAGYRQRAKQ